MKKHFYIFRHGQTVWNAEGRPQGQHEYPVPLTMEGREQAQKLADKLKDKKIKLIVSSDLLRAQQTGEIVAQALRVPLEFDRRLREVDYGILNGLYTIEREEVYPDFKKCYEDPKIPFPEGRACIRWRCALLMRLRIFAAAAVIGRSAYLPTAMR